MSGRPNIVVFLVDNLGMGELGCYGGGPLRGADTARIDAFAAEGMRLTNFAPESQCTPSRSALLTGRYAIRSGTYRVPLGGSAYGIVGWEKTLAEVLQPAGYRSSVVGKWHLGEEDGRWPTDHGFESWYGPERTYDEALWSADPFYDPDRDPVPYIMEAQAGDGACRVEPLTMASRKTIDLEFDRRAKAFMRSAVDEGDPFFLLYCHSMMHLPTTPRDEFVGTGESGEWGDSLNELDADFGSLLDELDTLGIADDTVVVFVGDNGPEESLPWRGSAGIFDGSYFTGMEGSLRTPCIVRGPGVAAGKTSNEIVHITDLFTTLALTAGVEPPRDRQIDGLDQRPLFTGRGDSVREGFPYWNDGVLYGVKWRDWKVSYFEQRGMWDTRVPLSMPKLVNILIDPQERENVLIHHTWVMSHIARIIADFEESVEAEPLIPFGAPVTYRPAADASHPPATSSGEDQS